MQGRETGDGVLAKRLLYPPCWGPPDRVRPCATVCDRGGRSRLRRHAVLLGAAMRRRLALALPAGLAAAWRSPLVLASQVAPAGAGGLRRRAMSAGTGADAAAAPPAAALPCIVDVMIVPSGVGPSHSKHIAGVVREFEANPALQVAVHSMGTNLEGEWDAVMGAVKVATLQLHATGIARVTTTLKIGTRVDRDDGYDMAYKLQRIQAQMHEQSEAAAAAAAAAAALPAALPAESGDGTQPGRGATAAADAIVSGGDLRDRVASSMKLAQVSTAGLDLNQTNTQLGDPAYDQDDETQWADMARRAGNTQIHAAVAGLLHSAASSGDLAQVLSLLEEIEAAAEGQGSELIDAVDEGPGTTGMTPLHWASKNGHVAVCEALLEAGASAAACDKFGRTALDLAQRYGHGAVVSLLTGKDPLIG
jgi:uncharacterized protein (TIGR00106 family)